MEPHVARLVAANGEELPLDVRLRELEEEGLISPEPLGRPTPTPVPLVPEGAAQRYLREDRDVAGPPPPP